MKGNASGRARSIKLLSGRDDDPSLGIAAAVLLDEIVVLTIHGDDLGRRLGIHLGSVPLVKRVRGAMPKG